MQEIETIIRAAWQAVAQEMGEAILKVSFVSRPAAHHAAEQEDEAALPIAA